MGSPLLLFFAVIVLAIAAVLSVVGIVLAVLAAATVAALTGVGVISLSALVGLSTRSASNGFQVFFMATSALAGTFAGAVLALVAAALLGPAPAPAQAAASGAAVGLIAGVAAGWLFNLCWTRLLAMITRRKAQSAFPVIVHGNPPPASAASAQKPGPAE